MFLFAFVSTRSKVTLGKADLAHFAEVPTPRVWPREMPRRKTVTPELSATRQSLLVSKNGLDGNPIPERQSRSQEPSRELVQLPRHEAFLTELGRSSPPGRDPGLQPCWRDRLSPRRSGPVFTAAGNRKTTGLRSSGCEVLLLKYLTHNLCVPPVEKAAKEQAQRGPERKRTADVLFRAP